MDIHCEEGGDTSDAAGIADVHYLIYISAGSVNLVKMTFNCINAANLR